MSNRTAVDVAQSQPPAALPSSVMGYLAWDHDRLDGLCEQAFEARGHGALEEAVGLFREFASGLRRHIGLEELLLFPEFERVTGMSPHAGPTAVMRHEHRLILASLEIMERTIATAGGEAEAARGSLLRVLVDHNAKEEQVLYPTTDRLLDESERRALVERLRAFVTR